MTEADAADGPADASGRWPVAGGDPAVPDRRWASPRRTAGGAAAADSGTDPLGTDALARRSFLAGPRPADEVPVAPYRPAGSGSAQPSPAPPAATQPGRRRAGRRPVALPGLRVGRHAASPGALSALRITVARRAPSVVLGVDVAGRPVMVELFGSRPGHLAVVGNGQLARILTLRAVALGGRAVVYTARAGWWWRLIPAVSDPSRLTVVAATARTLDVPGRTLQVYDGDVATAVPRPAPAPDQTEVTVVPAPTVAGLATARRATAVVVQRLARDDVTAFSRVLAFTPAVARGLPSIGDELALLVAPGLEQPFHVSLTDVERRLVDA